MLASGVEADYVPSPCAELLYAQAVETHSVFKISVALH